MNNMKKYLLLLLALCLLAACNRNASKLDDFSVKTLTVIDSVQFPEENLEGWELTDKAYYTMEVDEPITKNQALHDSIFAWLTKWMVEPDGNNTKSLLDIIENDKDVSLDLENTGPGYSSETFRKLMEVTDRYVTYSDDSYLYFGGAHGMPFYCGVTFDRITGKRFTFNMFKTLEGLNELVEEGIIEQHFYEVTGEEDFDFHLMLQVSEDEPFPLPSTEPWIENDSIHFVYGPYEIAAFAAGMPECAFPYSVMEKYLTDEGKKFFQ